MALFNDLFTESAAPVNETVDYLKDLPLTKFDENASFLDCGSKGLVLAEAGWTDICEQVNNMEALDETLDDVKDWAKDKAEKAGNKIKSGAKKVAAFLRNIPKYLKKIAQNIFGTINKFLTSIAAMVKNDQNIIQADAAKAGLKRYKDVNGKAPLIKGFLFNGNGKGETSTADDNFKTAIGNAQGEINKLFIDAKGKVKTDFTATKQEVLKTIRTALVGSTPSNGDVTSKSFITDMKASYGAKSKDGVEVTEEIINTAVTVVKGGYKDGQKSARETYKTSKEIINKWIKLCEDKAKQWDDIANKLEKENESELSEDVKKRAKAAETAGNIMMSCSGIMSSYTGAYCQLLHQNYSSLRGALLTCVGYSKGGKVGKKVYGESDTSIFGLDLI